MKTEAATSWTAPLVRLRGARVLVTGAGGFLGRSVCRRLAALGASVTGVGRSITPHGFEGAWLTCDLSDAEAVRTLIASCKPSHVLHLAGITLGQQDVSAVWPNFRANCLTTIALLTALTPSDCQRVVLTGSLREPMGEAEPLPTSPYAAAKFASSAYGRMFQRLYGLPVVIGRVFMVYGPGRQDMTKLVPYVTSTLLEGRPAALSGGKPAFDWVYIDDVVDALLLLATAEGLEGSTLDIGTGRLVSVADVARAIAQRLGRPELLNFAAVPDRAFEPERAADVSTMAARTGWVSSVSLEEGIDRVVRWGISGFG